MLRYAESLETAIGIEIKNWNWIHWLIVDNKRHRPTPVPEHTEDLIDIHIDIVIDNKMEVETPRKENNNNNNNNNKDDDDQVHVTSPQQAEREARRKKRRRLSKMLVL